MTTFDGHFLRLEPLTQAQGALHLVLDHKSGPVNTLGDGFRAELAEVIQRLAEQPPLGLLISSAKAGFLAGANITELQALLELDANQQIAFCEETAALLCALEDLPCPIVCAIQGFALGGGLEVALSSDYRIAGRKAILGFPEVGLGVLPGVGGTVKATRLAGFSAALEWLTSGRHYGSERALNDGLIDYVADESTLHDEAQAVLRDLMEGKFDWHQRRAQRRSGTTVNREALAGLRAKFQRRAPQLPAALAITELLAATAGMGRNEALKHEAKCFSVLASTASAKALVCVFQAQQNLKKNNQKLSGQHQIDKAGVLGAGIMGGGIAYTSALHGTPVLMKDIASEAIEIGLNEARKLVAKQVKQQVLDQTDGDAVLAAIEGQLDYTGFDSLDIVAEAVVENLTIKQQVLAETERHIRPNAVLASNTSSLKISDIATGLARPENLVGMHFFNPVHMMPLVEIVQGPQSSKKAVSKAIAHALQMRKTPLRVKDCAGFLVNRILGAYFAAFNLLVRDGADFRTIDRIMTDWGWPMGPAYLLDVAGLDTLHKAMGILGQAYPNVMEQDFTTAIACLASAGRYGQKSGAGFYRYSPDERGRPRKSDDAETDRLLRAIIKPDAQPPAEEEIRERMLLALVLEACRCLEENIAESAEDIDTGMRLGTGFPSHWCGPLWYADYLGHEKVLALCEHYRHCGDLYQAPSILIDNRQSPARFYRPASDQRGNPSRQKAG